MKIPKKVISVLVDDNDNLFGFEVYDVFEPPENNVLRVETQKENWLHTLLDRFRFLKKIKKKYKEDCSSMLEDVKILKEKPADGYYVKEIKNENKQ